MSPGTDTTCRQYHFVLEDMLDLKRSLTVSDTSAENLQRLDYHFSASLAVMEGHVLGVRQLLQNESRLTLHYQEGGGPQAFTAPSEDPCLDPLYETEGYDYPLIAVDFTSLGK